MWPWRRRQEADEQRVKAEGSQWFIAIRLLGQQQGLPMNQLMIILTRFNNSLVHNIHNYHPLTTVNVMA